MLSIIYENPWATIFQLTVASCCLNSIIGALLGQESRQKQAKTGTLNAGFFMPFFRNPPIF